MMKLKVSIIFILCVALMSCRSSEKLEATVSEMAASSELEEITITTTEIIKEKADSIKAHIPKEELKPEAEFTFNEGRATTTVYVTEKGLDVETDCGEYDVILERMEDITRQINTLESTEVAISEKEKGVPGYYIAALWFSIIIIVIGSVIATIKFGFKPASIPFKPF